MRNTYSWTIGVAAAILSLAFAAEYEGTATAATAAPAPVAAAPTDTAAAVVKPVGGGQRESADGKPPFTFVVVGGTTQETPEPSAPFAEAVKWINKINPDFSVSAGDNVKGTGGVAQQWDAFEKVAAGLTKPMYLIAGNHDTQKAGPEWTKRFGPFYHAFMHKGCQFIFLSSDTPGAMGNLDDAQVKWLEETLASTSAVSRFVFCHEGFWREGSKEMRELWNTKIVPLFKKYNVVAAFAGHHAIYELKVVDGIRYYVTQGGAMHGQSGGGARTPPERGGFQHVLKVVVAADGSATVTLVGADREEPDTIGQTAAGKASPKASQKITAPPNPTAPAAS